MPSNRLPPRLFAAGLTVGLHLLLGVALAARWRSDITPRLQPITVALCQLAEEPPAAEAAREPTRPATSSQEGQIERVATRPEEQARAVPPASGPAPESAAPPKPPAPPRKEASSTARKQPLSPRASLAAEGRSLAQGTSAAALPTARPSALLAIDDRPSGQDEAGLPPAPALPSANPAPLAETATTPLAAAPPAQAQERQPQYRETPQPPYPALARRLGYQGTVELKALVTQEGTVGELEMVTSSGYPALDGAALSTVQQWRFEPGTRDGARAAMWIKIPIHFSLQ